MTNMTIEKIKSDRDQARKLGDSFTLAVLQSVLADFEKKSTEGKTRKDLTGGDVLTVLRGAAKKRRETSEIYKEAGAEDRAENEAKEAELVESYLPEEMTEEDLTDLIRKTIEDGDLKAMGMRAMGRVMGALKTRNDVDPSKASKITKKLLSED